MLFRSIESAAQPLLEACQAATHILVTTHINPDGDAVGSIVAMGRTLRCLGKQVSLVAPTALPQVAQVLADVNDIQVYERSPALPESVDLVLLLDTGNISRIEPIYHEQQDFLAQRPLVIIDHHATNSGEGMLNLVLTDAASTCEILALLFEVWNMRPDAETATALLLGTITDTQSFQTAHTSPQSLHVAADLLQCGGRLNEIMRAMLFSKPFTHAKALGLALQRMQRKNAVIWTELTREMLDQTGADDEVGDEITAYMSRIGGAKAYVLFKERPDGAIKLSLRSAPGIDIGSVAHELGGGGHREAAGATLHMSMHEAQQLVLQRVHSLVT